jgi:hypothetical protein
MRRFLVSGAIMSLLALGAQAAPPEKAPEQQPQAQISFARLGGIQDWRADGEKALYIQGRDRQWYRAELMSACIGLNFAQRIGFVTEPNGSFDRFSAILVEHRECQVTSLVRSDPPPRAR